MNLSRLKWGFLLTLVVLFGFVEFGRYQLAPYLNTLSGRVLMDLVILVGSVFFFGVVFELISRLQHRLERQNRELLALNRAALDIYGQISLDTVLQKVVDQASQLVDARYGAVAVYDENGQIRQFAFTGLGEEARGRIGAPPVGRGLLGVVLKEGQRLRIADLASDPRSSGFPENHPEMHSLLAVPIACKSQFRGNLYVSEKQRAGEFSEEDEETLARFATAAAIAIDNADLNQRLRDLAVAQERVRIARELHDGMAQVLAYVNTKAQAVEGFLERGRSAEARRQLGQLAAAAREVLADAREGILALRTPAGPDKPLAEALGEYIGSWQNQSGIDCRLEIRDEVQLPPTIELQLLRIIQEALSNARKHSGARSVRVRLSRNDDRLAAEVVDDGTGFDPRIRARSDFPRFGLAIMRERAESVGGSLQLDSSPGGGTRVKIEIPIGTPTAPTGA